MNKIVLATLLCCALGQAHASPAPGSEASTASELMSEGSAMVVGGSLMSLAGAGAVVVKSVEASGDGVMVVLAGASDAASATLKLSGQAARKAAHAAGAAMHVAAAFTGFLLIMSGEVIAYIPNEAGKALLLHSPVEL